MPDAVGSSHLNWDTAVPNPVITADRLIGLGGGFAVSPAALLARVLQDWADPAALDLLYAGGMLDPAALFDGFASPRFFDARPLLGRMFAVVSPPRGYLGQALAPGDVMLRRALGEPGLGHVAFIADAPPCPPTEAWRRGWRTDAHRPGQYAMVVEPGTHPHRLMDRYARRITDGDGRLPADTLIVRPVYRHRGTRARLTGSAREALAGNNASAPAAPQPPAPPIAGWYTRQDGIDLYESNTVPTTADMARVPIRFIIHKCSEQPKVGALITDTQFQQRWIDTAAAGLIRGAYHYYRHKDGVTGTTQADTVVGQVGRLVPGDLPPALDLEGDAVVPGEAEPSLADWRTELQDFLDRLETRLGRIPMVYTGASAWKTHISGRTGFIAANFEWFGTYPLWVKAYLAAQFVDGIDLDNGPHTQAFWRAAHKRADGLYSHRGGLNPPLPVSWQSWELFQYSPHTPGTLSGLTFDNGTDFDVSRSGIYALRGLADLGRTAPYVAGSVRCIAATNSDGSVTVLEFVGGSWAADNPQASVGGAPPAAGDPAAGALGNDHWIVYRGNDGALHGLTRSVGGTASWSATTLTADVVDDPFFFVAGNIAHVVVRDTTDRQRHFFKSTGAWQEDSLASASGAPAASGALIAYLQDGAVHVLSRAEDAGHLYDLYPSAGVAKADDLTALARDASGQPPPAATYRPSTYTPRGAAPRIVFRALRGAIWQIERDSLRASNLAAAAVWESGGGPSATGAPLAAGSPTALFVDVPRIAYRARDSELIEIYISAAGPRWRVIGTGAAADPTMAVDTVGGFLTFRSEDGSIVLMRLANGSWINDAAQPVVVPPTGLPPVPPASIPV